MSNLQNAHVNLGDVVTWESAPDYTRETKTVTNSSGDVMDLPAGYPMDDNVPVVNGQEANTDGITTGPLYLADGEVGKVGVIARGPAVVNQDALPTTDYAGAALTVATIATALAAFSPKIIVRHEPTKTLTQTT